MPVKKVETKPKRGNPGKKKVVKKVIKIDEPLWNQVTEHMNSTEPIDPTAEQLLKAEYIPSNLSESYDDVTSDNPEHMKLIAKEEQERVAVENSSQEEFVSQPIQLPLLPVDVVSREETNAMSDIIKQQDDKLQQLQMSIVGMEQNQQKMQESNNELVGLLQQYLSASPQIQAVPQAAPQAVSQTAPQQEDERIENVPQQNAIAAIVAAAGPYLSPILEIMQFFKQNKINAAPLSDPIKTMMEGINVYHTFAAKMAEVQKTIFQISSGNSKKDTIDEEAIAGKVAKLVLKQLTDSISKNK